MIWLSNIKDNWAFAIPRYQLFIVGLGVFGSLFLFADILLCIYQRTIFIWDEAIYANNAVEMASNHQFFRYTRDGIADHYNSKPPLGIWLQVLCIKIFGYYHWSVRLPSLIAFMGVIGLFFQFSKSIGVKIFVPIIATFILLSCRGLIRPHVFLTADLDGMLVFCTTFLFFIRLHQIQTKKISNTSMHGMGIIFLAAFMLKSVAVFLLLPALFVSFCLERDVLQVTKNKFFYLWMLVNVCCIVGYYMLRERLDPGYFQVVVQSEFLRFTSKVMEWHEQPFWFYIRNLLLDHFSLYTILCIVVSIFYWQMKSAKHKKLVRHLFLFSLVYLLTISIPSVKLDWYDAPLYPLLCFAMAIMLHELIEHTTFHASKIVSTTLSVLLGSIVLFQMYTSYAAIRKYKFQFQPQEQEAAILFAIDKKLNLSKYTVLMDVEDGKVQHADALHFYRKAFYWQQHKEVIVKRSVSEIVINDTLLVYQPEKVDSLRKQFTLRHFRKEIVNLYIVTAKK